MSLAERLRSYGASEEEIRRATCEHEFDDVWMRTFMGCTRTCRKCGQMECHPNHCHPVVK